MTSRRRRREDTAEGCRSLETDDRTRAADTMNLHARASFERSAASWAARAKLLDRLAANFSAQIGAHNKDAGRES